MLKLRIERSYLPFVFSVVVIVAVHEHNVSLRLFIRNVFFFFCFLMLNFCFVLFCFVYRLNILQKSKTMITITITGNNKHIVYTTCLRLNHFVVFVLIVLQVLGTWSQTRPRVALNAC